jgi:hypothetical protein
VRKAYARSGLIHWGWDKGYGGSQATGGPFFCVTSGGGLAPTLQVCLVGAGRGAGKFGDSGGMIHGETGGGIGQYGYSVTRLGPQIFTLSKLPSPLPWSVIWRLPVSIGSEKEFLYSLLIKREYPDCPICTRITSPPCTR